MGGNDILEILINLSQAFSGVFTLIKIVFALIGLILFGLALIDIYVMSNQHSQSANAAKTVAGVVYRILVSVVLTSMFYFVDLTQNTLAIPSSSGALAYQGAGPSALQKAAIEAIIGCFMIAGYLAFGKGWLLLDKHFNGGREGLSAPIWHIIGGVALVYIDVWVPLFMGIAGFQVGNIF